MLTVARVSGSCLVIAAALGSALATAPLARAATFGDAELVSRASSDTGGAGGNNQSAAPAVSADGRYVAFSSWASNLATDDAELHPDVFLRDTLTGSTTLLSRASDAGGGAPGNAHSFAPSISGDGRFVAFTSRADNLVEGDDNEHADVFLRDTATGTTTVVTAGGDGDSVSPLLSNDARYLVFSSDAENLGPESRAGWTDVFVWDRETGATTALTPSESDPPYHHAAYAQAISGDGRYALMQASVGDVEHGITTQLFRIDRLDASTELVSRADGADGAMDDWGARTGQLSADGRYVAFESTGNNLSPDDGEPMSDVYLRDMTAGTTRLVSPASDEEWGGMFSADSATPSISGDGMRVAFATSSDMLRGGGGPDNTNYSDVVVWDAHLQETTLVSHTPFAAGAGHGEQPSWAPAMSADGHSIAFTSLARDLSDEDDDSVGVTDVLLSRELVATGEVPAPDPERPPLSPQGTGRGPDPPPELVVTAGRTQRLRRAIRVVATAASEPVWLTSSGRVSTRARSSAYRLRGAAVRFIAQGARATLTLRLPTRAYRAARRALRRGARVTATIVVRARDAGGNRVIKRRTIRLKR
jgi:Tol biopolymer transport system component